MNVEEITLDHFKHLPDSWKEPLAALLEALQAHHAKLNGKKKEKPVTVTPNA